MLEFMASVKKRQKAYKDSLTRLRLKLKAINACKDGKVHGSFYIQ